MKPTVSLELIVEDHGDSVVLRRAEDLPATTLEDLVGCAGYRGSARTLEDMEAASARGAGNAVNRVTGLSATTAQARKMPFVKRAR